MSDSQPQRIRLRSKFRRWLHPVAIEQEYQLAAIRFDRQLKAITEDVLRQDLPFIVAIANRYRPDAEAAKDWTTVAAAAGVTSYVTELGKSLQRILDLMEGHADALWQIARQLGRQTSVFNDLQFRKIIRAALRVNIFQAEPWLNAELAAYETESLALIKSIPEQFVERLRGTIIQGLRAGSLTEDIMADIQEVYPVTRARAELIALDQISKLNGTLTQLRQQGIGVESYVWHGVLDSRERPSHVAREGQIYKWSEGPPGGQNPGLEIRCRCWAYPVIPELQDIKGAIIP